jgi:hypothetical protein
MNRRLKRVAWGAAALAPVIFVVLFIFTFWLSVRPVPLAGWVKRVQRPGYRLISSIETPDHSYFAFFDAGDDRLAFCSLVKEKRGDAAISGRVVISTSTGVTTITTADGEEALDTRQRRFTVLTRKILAVYNEIDGTEFPIKRDITGDLRVRYRVSGDEILDTEIPWGRFRTRAPFPERGRQNQD